MDYGFDFGDGMGGGIINFLVIDLVMFLFIDFVFFISFFIVMVGGNCWWNGFMVELIVINVLGIKFNSWSFIFDMVYKIFGSFWGVIV